MKRLLPLLAFAFAAQSATLVERFRSQAVPMTNPFAQQPIAIGAGEKLFRHNCAACHGIAGRGTSRSRTPPLAIPEVRNANPGVLFYILRNGSPTHRMPSFSSLTEPQRWQIIAYLQTLR